MPHIDLNSDVGEGFGAWGGGPDELLVPYLTSVNIACGYHAGDPSTIRRTCELAVAHDCVIGAQVSYPDLAGFGRRFMDLQHDDLRDAILYQLGALDAMAGGGTRAPRSFRSCSERTCNTKDAKKSSETVHSSKVRL